MKRSLFVPMAALVITLGGAVACPINTAYAQQEQIYGSQLMTEQERNEFRAQMRAATSEEQRQQIRWEHHNRMQARAKDRGVTLPDDPPMFGMHRRPGRGGGGQGRPRLPQGGGGGRRGG